MSNQSPLFQSAIELFGHAIEHFNGGSQRDRKFVILHLANAVELIFKDKLLDLGESIYSNPKETISIHASLEKLAKSNAKVPNFSKIQLLIDERNTIQHRFGFPDELTTLFYINATYEFFDAFLQDNYSLSLNEVLKEAIQSETLQEFYLFKNPENSEFSDLLKLTNKHPVSALLSAYSYFETLIQEVLMFDRQGQIAQESEIRSQVMLTMSVFKRHEIELPSDFHNNYDDLRELRNQVAHAKTEPSTKEVKSAIRFIMEFKVLTDSLRGKRANA